MNAMMKKSLLAGSICSALLLVASVSSADELGVAEVRLMSDEVAVEP
ncbi:MAG: hypothetical protein ACRERU_10545 [Methylococcales bacterium]